MQAARGLLQRGRRGGVESRRPAGCGPARPCPGRRGPGRARSSRVSASGSWLGSPGRPSAPRGTKTGMRGSSSSCPSSARIRPIAVNSQPSPRRYLPAGWRPGPLPGRRTGGTASAGARPGPAGARGSGTRSPAGRGPGQARGRRWPGTGRRARPGSGCSSGPAAMVSRSPAASMRPPACRTTEVTSAWYSPKSGSSQRARSRDAAVPASASASSPGPVPRSTSSAPLVARYSRTCSAARSSRASSSCVGQVLQEPVHHVAAPADAEHVAAGAELAGDLGELFPQPLQDLLIAGVFQVQVADLHDLLLAVPVDAAVALLQPVGVPRQLVVDDDVAAVLQVQALSGGVGGQQHRARRAGELPQDLLPAGQRHRAVDPQQRPGSRGFPPGSPGCPCTR